MKKPARAAPRIAVTMGDPAGIGPEIIVKALNELIGKTGASFAIAADPEVMEKAVRAFGGARLKTLFKNCPRYVRAAEAGVKRGPLCLVGTSGLARGKAEWRSLEDAYELVEQRTCAAMVTAPVNKAALLAAGFPAPGHTGWLELRTGKKAVMMLASGSLRVVPVTIHVPVAMVSSLLTRKLVLETISIVNSELVKKFRVKAPRIAVSGLNPHAGESGEIGMEEKRVIAPAVEASRKKGIKAFGPLPADAMFTPEAIKTFDAAVCMYHDQAMIPIKALARQSAVNVTLGLPVIRTSPAHGTAPDIAWKGAADPSSMIEAIRLAITLSGGAG